MRLLFISVGFILLSYNCSFGQKFLQIERAGQVKAEKIFIGQTVFYRLKGSNEFRAGQIEDLKVDEEIILFVDSYVKIDQVDAFRYQRNWSKSVGTSLFWFGAGWSFFAAIGTATDDDPTTSYRWSDAVVSASTITTSFVVSKAFKYRTIRFGKRKRLRILEVAFTPPEK